MELAILSTSWKLVRAITEIVDRLEQTREDARSLKYLETQAKTFLTTVTDGLAGIDPVPYRETISSLELLYKDILTTSEKYILDGKIKQMWKASKTRRNILNLNRRMRLFIDTYLLQVATETARLNLRAFSEPPPPLPPISASSEKAMWKVMSWSNGATTGDRTSIKPLSVVSDPMNPLLTPPHSQNTMRRTTPAESVQQSPSDETSPHADPSHMSTPDEDQNSGTNTSTDLDDPCPANLGPIALAFHNLGKMIDTRMASESTTSPYNPWVPSTSTQMPMDRDSEPQVPILSTGTSATESMHLQADGNHNSLTENPQPPGFPGNVSLSAESGNAYDVLVQQCADAIIRGLSQGQSEAAGLTSPFPTRTHTTPRRPGFDRRLQAQRDGNFTGIGSNPWLSFEKNEILYTDGKQVKLQEESRLFSWLQYVSYKGVMAQNRDGKCGLVDPEATFSEGFFSSQPYLIYLD